MVKGGGMRIGELAKATGFSVEAIRFYEREGLLAAISRNGSNYREFAPQHEVRLRFIRRCRGLDMSHEEIKALLALESNAKADCGAVNDLVDEHLRHVDERIKELRCLKQSLRSLRAQCGTSGPMVQCGILNQLSKSVADRARPSVKMHLGQFHRTTR